MKIFEVGRPTGGVIVSRSGASPVYVEARSYSSSGSEVPESGVRNRPPLTAFDEIYAAWFSEVARWARAMGGSNADTEDLCQEVFLTVRRKLPDFDGENLPGWLYRITQRAVRTHLRKAWLRRALFLPAEDWQRLPADGPGPVEQLVADEKRRGIERILAKLSLAKRTALVLSEVEGRTGDEIAALEGVPVATIYSRIHYAKKEFMALARAEDES